MRRAHASQAALSNSVTAFVIGTVSKLTLNMLEVGAADAQSRGHDECGAWRAALKRHERQATRDKNCEKKGDDQIDFPPVTSIFAPNTQFAGHPQS